MSNTSRCINDILPREILEKVLLLSVESFADALRISSTCCLWRKLIFNPLMIQRYWTFDNEHRRKNLIHWWNFNENISDQNNPFIHFPIADCFLGKCVTISDKKKKSAEEHTNDRQYIIDRSSNYTLALWLSTPKAASTIRCLFMVTDDDYDYARSAGVCVDENNYLCIAFASSIGSTTVKSNVKIKPDEWFHIALVQERRPGANTPCQKLWINGRVVLTVEVPIAAYSDTATVLFYTWDTWNRSIADISLWSRCLSPLEIRAIYKQKTSIEHVNITKYIFEHLNN